MLTLEDFTSRIGAPFQPATGAAAKASGKFWPLATNAAVGSVGRSTAIRLFASKIADAVVEGRALATEHDFTADKIISDETPAEEGMMEYTEYVDPKYAEKIMAETASITDEAAPVSQRKGPASETAEQVAEPVATEGGV